MHLYRAMLSALIAVAIVLAPMAAAWAGGATGIGAAMSDSVPHSIDGHESGTASPMEDCASMIKGMAGLDDCRCCDKDKACPPQLCLAKCFQFLGLDQQLRPVPRLVTALFRPIKPEHPPDWSDQPQPPPPRT